MVFLTDELLRTKLMPPPGQAYLVPRMRLTDRLTSGLRGPVTLVVAPAGSGKTSLLRSWRAMVDHQQVAWLLLDDDDNDPIRFWHYVVAALETAYIDAIERVRAHLDASQRQQPDRIAAVLINALVSQEDDVVLVLDDYHVIETSAIHESLTFLIERLPPCLRLMIVTRVDPPLPLARWRVRGQLTEVRAADLRFTEPEATLLLSRILDQGLSSEQVALLTERTEGWAAGLHLAALALRGREDVAQFLDRFTGSHHFVMTYLIEDVLENQPESVQRFLLETSVLGHLSGPLCDALTGRTDGQDMLRRLVAENLFTQALDDSEHWHRYHQLFGSMLRHRLEQVAPELVPELHRRASLWYDAHDLKEQAIDHALRGKHHRHAARLISQVEARRLRGGTATLRRWIEQLPEDLVVGEPQLCVDMAWAHLMSGPLATVEQWLKRAIAAVAPDDTSGAIEGEAAAIRSAVASFAGDMHVTIEQAELAMRLLPEDDYGLRGIAAMGLGQAYRFEADLKASSRAYREAVELSRRTGNLYVLLDSLSDLGLVLMQQGKLREAERVFAGAQQTIADNHVEHLPVAGSVAVILPELLRERNELDDAVDIVQQGIEIGHRAAKMDLLITGCRTLGKIRWSLGDWDWARAALQESFEHARSYGLTHTARGIEALIAHLSLARGDLTGARAWAGAERPEDGIPRAVLESERLTVARVRLAEGRVDEALAITGELLDVAEQGGWFWSALAIHAVQALAYQRQGDTDRALVLLGTALRRAAPEGFARVFLDEGEPMTALLRQAVARGVEVDYARRLLSLSGETTREPMHTARVPMEPLSDREAAVLRLLSAGLSSPAIADELYVSPSTVRTHLKSIYRKLDVHSRDQAVTRARELDLG